MAPAVNAVGAGTRDDARTLPGHRKDVPEWRTQPDAACWRPGSQAPRWACSAGAPRRRARRPPSRHAAPRADATPPRMQPTADDIELLEFAESFELAARDLYQAALDAGADEPMIACMREQPPGVRRHPRRASSAPTRPARRDDGLYDELEPVRTWPTSSAVAAAGYDLESTLVATHTELLRPAGGHRRRRADRLDPHRRGPPAARCSPTSPARGDDFDALFDDDAEPLAVSRPSGG